jgi:hypothetical protein
MPIADAGVMAGAGDGEDPVEFGLPMRIKITRVFLNFGGSQEKPELFWSEAPARMVKPRILAPTRLPWCHSRPM